MGTSTNNNNSYNINDKEDYELSNKLLWIRTILQYGKKVNIKDSLKAYKTVLSLLEEMFYNVIQNNNNNDSKLSLDIVYVHEHLGYLYKYLYDNKKKNEKPQQIEINLNKSIYHYE